MKRSEIADLLTIAAGLERSGWVPDENDVDLWHAMSIEGEWESFAAARRALFVYRTEQPNYPLRPGHITQVLERVRRTARSEYNELDDPAPREVYNDRSNPLAYRDWRIARSAEYRANAMREFAAGARTAKLAIGAAS